MKLQTERLTYTYNPNAPFEKTAVEDISFSVDAGEFVGIIGHTGSGKSTLMQMCNGLLKPTSGRVLIDGQDIWAKPKDIRKYRFQVGLVFQYPEQQLFMETVEKDIAFGPKNKGMSDEEARQAVVEAARFVDLSPSLMKKSPFELSGGEKRRAAIAGVLSMEPDVLILDEPTAGLDPYGRDVILSSLKDYQQEKGTTLLLVSHSMEDVARLAQKVLVLKEGRVLRYGATAEVFSHREELEQAGLALPQITRIFHGLKEKGYPVPTDIFSAEAGRQALITLVGEPEK